MKRSAYFDGRYARAVRESTGLSLTDFARRAGITKGLLSDLENGNHTNPTLETISRIAGVIGVDVGDLVTGYRPARTRVTMAERIRRRKGTHGPG